MLPSNSWYTYTMADQSCFKRTEYTHHEKQKIVEFIVKYKSYNVLRGNKFWQEMQKAKVVERTWQSAKEHFRRKIIYSLNTLNISPKERHLIQEGWNNSSKVKPDKSAKQIKRPRYTEEEEYNEDVFSDEDSCDLNDSTTLESVNVKRKQSNNVLSTLQKPATNYLSDEVAGPSHRQYNQISEENSDQSSPSYSPDLLAIKETNKTIMNIPTPSIDGDKTPENLDIDPDAEIPDNLKIDVPLNSSAIQVNSEIEIHKKTTSDQQTQTDFEMNVCDHSVNESDTRCNNCIYCNIELNGERHLFVSTMEPEPNKDEISTILSKRLKIQLKNIHFVDFSSYVLLRDIQNFRNAVYRQFGAAISDGIAEASFVNIDIERVISDLEICTQLFSLDDDDSCSESSNSEEINSPADNSTSQRPVTLNMKKEPQDVNVKEENHSYRSCPNVSATLREHNNSTDNSTAQRPVTLNIKKEPQDVNVKEENHSYRSCPNVSATLREHNNSTDNSTAQRPVTLNIKKEPQDVNVKEENHSYRSSPNISEIPVKVDVQDNQNDNELIQPDNTEFFSQSSPETTDVQNTISRIVEKTFYSANY